MSDADLLALLWRTTTRVVTEVNDVEDETAEALEDMADAAARVFTRLFEN